MPFNILTTQTVADVDKIMDNFYYLWDGDRLPYTQTAVGSLASSDNTCDIGSSTYRWNEIYANKAYCSAGNITAPDMFVRIASIELSAPATEIEFTGLNSDLYKYFIIYQNFIPTTPSWFMTCNNESASSIYAAQFRHDQGLPFNFVNYSTSGGIYFDLFFNVSEILFSIRNRRIFNESLEVLSSTRRSIFHYNVNNSTITSLKFYLLASATITAGTKITIWGN